ncbi:hypothetical protein WMY93_026226 [Mugilogobius chulae]|uniref:B30.2/SPRY domain-containing protein n=1 Tax=Mugilogobius chulae TaxID=88201 RepID=A0AAW0N159_9GOBI
MRDLRTWTRSGPGLDLVWTCPDMDPPGPGPGPGPGLEPGLRPRPGPGPSCVSLKSDDSRNLPPLFKENSSRLKQAVCHVLTDSSSSVSSTDMEPPGPGPGSGFGSGPSCVSLKSNESRNLPPLFGEAGPEENRVLKKSSANSLTLSTGGAACTKMSKKKGLETVENSLVTPNTLREKLEKTLRRKKETVQKTKHEKLGTSQPHLHFHFTSTWSRLDLSLSAERGADGSRREFCVSEKRRVQKPPPLFRDARPEENRDLEPDSRKTQLDHVFARLEQDVLRFVQQQLQKLHRLLASDYPECSESEEEEQSTEVLNIALDFLKKMEQEHLAQRLQNRTVVGVSREKLKSDLKQRFSRVFEGVAKAGDSAPLKQIYTELYITEGGASEVNQEHEVRLMESASRRAAAPEKTITCEDMLKPRPHSPEPIRSVLTVGVAGVGKTVLTQKFSLDWAEGETNQELQLLFPFTFRELNVLRDTQFSLVQLLQHFFSLSKDLCSFNQLQSWRRTGPGDARVLETYGSWRRTGPGDAQVWRRTGPGDVQVLETYRSWRRTGPGDTQVLETYRSWRRTGPGDVQVLQTYRSWRRTGPGDVQVLETPPSPADVQVLETYRSCRRTGPGDAPSPGDVQVLETYRSWTRPCVLETYRSWRRTGPGDVQVLETYRSWRHTGPGQAPESWRRTGPGDVQVLETSSTSQQSLTALLQLDNIPYFRCPPPGLGIATTSNTIDHATTAPSAALTLEAENMVHSDSMSQSPFGVGRSSPESVLFIFDGLDECRLPLNFSRTRVLTDPTESVSVDVLLVNLIRGNLLPSALLWITTRPAAANQIPAECVSMVTEVRGFTDDQKELYFRKRFTDDTIISHIKSIRSLYIMSYIPIFCWILSTVIQKLLEQTEEPELPRTLTQMYIHFLVLQLKQKNIKYDEKQEPDSAWSTENKKMVLSLSKLAFEQLQKGNLIFYDSDLSECGLDAAAASVYSGVFTQVFREEPGLYQDKVYCFIHLSLQEFLAALHVHQTFYSSGLNLMETPQSSESPESEVPFYVSAVDQALQSPNGHLDLFLRFLLGLSLPTNQRLLQGLLTHTGSDTTNQATVKYIKQKLNEKSLSAERSLNMFYCLNELNDQSLEKEIRQYMREGFVSDRYISPAHWSALSFVLLSSDSDLQEFDLRNYEPSEQALLGLLPVVKASTKAILIGCGLSPHSCGPLASVLSSSSLTHLDLSHNDLQDSGVELLCDGLKSAPCRLETLRLSVCLVSERGGAALASALSSAHSRVTELDLSYNHPGPSAELLTALQRPLQSVRLLPAGERWMVPGLRKYSCEFSLDPNTAHRLLLLSEDLQTVTFVKQEQQYPDHQDRFSDWRQVLSSTGLSGRCYWEVDWSGDSVSVAVSYRRIRRRGKSQVCGFGRNDQSWSLDIYKGDYSVRHNNQQKHVSLLDRVIVSSDRVGVSSGRVGVSSGRVGVSSGRAGESSGRAGVSSDRVGVSSGRVGVSSGRAGVSSGRVGVSSDRVGVSSGRVGVSSGRVGVFLDTEAGALSFYDVLADRKLYHLYTFTCSFSEELFPGFYLGLGSSASVVNLRTAPPGVY